MAKTIKKRIPWIDWAKVFLIYLMVVGHAFPKEPFNSYIYAFHMPAFFIISGYLYKEHPWFQTIKKFLLPIFCFSVVNVVIYCLAKYIKGTLDTTHLLYRILIPFWGGNTPHYAYAFPGVWFIIALIIGRLLMGDIHFFSFTRKFPIFIIILITTYLTIIPFVFPDNPLQDYNFYTAIPSLPFMLFGYYMKEQKLMEKIKGYKKLIFPLLFFISAFYQGRCSILGLQFGISYITFFLTAICGSLSLFLAIKNIQYNNIIKILSTGTILVLAFNFNFITAFRLLSIKLHLSYLTTTGVYPWILGLCVLAICYYPIKWLNIKCPILLGK